MEPLKKTDSKTVKFAAEYIDDIDPLDQKMVQLMRQEAGIQIQDFVEKKKNILKSVFKHVPWDKTAKIADVSVFNRGKEDRIYLYEKDIQQRMRRGHSILSYTGVQGEKNQFRVLRKGLPKFFYLRESHLLFGEGKIESEEEMRRVHGSDEVEEDLLILDNVYKNLKNSESITIFQCRKANGECAHVSFVQIQQEISGKNQTSKAQ